MTTFFTSDTHFGHKGILKHGRDRFFADVETMDEELIRRWNAVVSSNDIVYHLGDVFFSKRERAQEIIARLNGEIHVVLGNHDPDKPWFRELFQSVDQYKEINVAGQHIVMCHYPFLTWNRAHYGAWMLHGHSHGSLKETTQTRLDVGVDVPGHAFAPLSFEEIAERMRHRQYTPVDHHGS